MTATRRSEDATGHALLGEGGRFHLTCRLLGRGLLALSRSGSARAGRHRGALFAWLVADLVLWEAMRRRPVPLLVRLGVDLADVAFWASVGDQDMQTALASQIAVEIEAGFAWGPASFAIPIVEGAVATGARRAGGHRGDPTAHVPHLGAVAAGRSVRWMEQRRLGRAREEHAADLSAKRVRAFLAGQNEVAMGASSVVDELTPVASMLGAAGEGSALTQVRAGWKADLAEQSRRHALYLDQAVRLWEHSHNDHPDLSSYAEVVVAEGDGTELLTGFQARALASLLEFQGLRGRVHISLADRRRSADRRPGRGFGVVVNGVRLEVPADPDVHIVEFDPGPPVMLFAAWAAMMPIRRRDGAVPVAAASLVAASWLAASAYTLRTRAKSTLSRELAMSTALAAFQGLMCATTARVRRTENGAHLYHGTYGIAPALLVLSASWQRAPRHHRNAAIAATVGISAAAYWLAERPRSLADFACTLAWPLAAAFGGSGVQAATEWQAELFSGSLQSDLDRSERASYSEGRSSVLALVRAAITEAELAIASADLEPQMRRLLEERLHDISATTTELESVS